MERTAVYRRALAPLSLVVGGIGMVSGIVAWLSDIRGTVAFVVWWFVTGLIAAGAGFFKVRTQALKDQEPVWSPPTKRVFQALAPPLVSGFITGIIFIVLELDTHIGISFLPILWMLFFGSGLHSAGFFMKRGIRLLGWIFILTALIELALLVIFPQLRDNSLAGHFIMATVFGGYNLAYCLYLYLTEKEEIH